MSLQICILASGSSGNATLVRTPDALFLIDCGIPPRVAEARLKRLGLELAQIAAICVTHLDHDHFNPSWGGVIVQQDIPVFCAAAEMMTLLQRAGDADLSAQVRPFDDAPFEPVAGVAASAIPVSHDEAGSHAFHFDGFGVRVGYATDLGHVPAELVDRFCGVDLLAIESNYDPQLQQLSGRPMFLQRRIMGGRGHLSNAQAVRAAT
jgi:phosphoribosyl 1,2-cyclic phosphodiesterase